MMAVEMKPGPRIEPGVPRVLFDSQLTVTPTSGQYNVTPEGQRFLIQLPVTEATPTPITVVVNWTAAFKK